MKSSEVRIAGDQSMYMLYNNCATYLWCELPEMCENDEWKQT